MNYGINTDDDNCIDKGAKSGAFIHILLQRSSETIVNQIRLQ